MRSMTGFGRGDAENYGRKVTIEIKAVNHRFLDINVRMPRVLGFAEEPIRKAIKEKLSRGRIDVYVNYSTCEDETKTARADIGLIKSYFNAAKQAGQACGLDDDIKLSHILSIPDAILIEEAPEDEEKQVALVLDAVETAVRTLIEMRKREGSELLTSIVECLDSLDRITKLIVSRKSLVPAEYAEKLKLRIAELLNGNDIDETRFNTEVAYMADKADITEETVRLAAHINQFRNAVMDQAIMGRKLDFMVQEMNRELNTIGSKSQDLKITNAVIEGKSIVEKIREQVQNIE